MPAGGILERFVLAHAEDHVGQLEAILADAGPRPRLNLRWGLGERCADAKPTTGCTDRYRWPMAPPPDGPYVADPRGKSSAPVGAERDAMQTFKSQTFRIVMFLSVLASSSLVLTAGRRWF